MGTGPARRTARVVKALSASTAADRRGQLPSGAVTFVFTDIEGSTQRWERNPEAMQDAVRRHDAVMRAAIAGREGYVFKTIGDAFCATFWRPEDAIAAMLDAQRALAAEDFSAVDGLRVRAAIHTGTADERDGDYFGPVVNRVARLVSIGHGGQVLVSGIASELARAMLPPQTTLRALGEHRLKDLIQSESVFQLVAPDLQGEHPPLRSLGALRNNLPTFLTTFVGRDAEVAEITELLGQQRLVTVVGSGGIGKTRTSLQVAANLLDESGDGVWFVELAPLTNGDDIPATIAREIWLTLPQSGDQLDNLTSALSTKHMLLVFDNCEHLIVPTARVVSAILRNCPNVKMLASSRQALGIRGEQAFRLPSLEVPDATDSHLTANEASKYEAVSLFVERARAIDRSFELTDANAATVVDICRRLDGIALAIELAAARVRLLSPRQLRDRLHERFRLLTGGSRDVLPRQQTLRALIDWSYDLLDERERPLFRRLGMFINGFTLQGAVAVGGGDELDEFDVVDVLASLVDKSLVLAEAPSADDDDALRYRLLDSTRAYALERLLDAGEYETLARRRAAFFEAFAGDGTMLTANVRASLAAVDAELENVRETLRWALEEGHDVELGARIALALGRFWLTRVPREGQRWLELAQSKLSNGADPVLAAGILLALASMLPHGIFERLEATKAALAASRATQDPLLMSNALCAFGEQMCAGGYEREAAAALDEALVLARAGGHAWYAARALADMMCIAVDRGDIALAQRLGQNAMDAFAALEALDGIAYVSMGLGQAEFSAGNLNGAIELMGRARAAYGQLRNNWSSACAANLLAVFALIVDDFDEARLQSRDVLELLRTDRHPMFLACAIANLGHVATLRGNPVRGALLLGYADAAYARLAHQCSEPDRLCRAKHGRALTEVLSPEELQRIVAESASLSEDRALEEALKV